MKTSFKILSGASPVAIRRMWGLPMITGSARASALFVALVLAALALPASAEANLITNGSFDQGAPYSQTNTVPGWTSAGEAGFAASSTWSLTPPDGSTYNAFVGGGGPFTSGIFSALFSLTAGQTYTFSFDAAGISAYTPGFTSTTPWQPGAMGMYYYLFREGESGNTNLAEGAVWPTAINAWTTVTAAGTVPQSGNHRVVVYQYNSTANLSYAAVDNFSLVAVPEPGSLALAGIGIAAAAWASRRRSHKQP